MPLPPLVVALHKINTDPDIWFVPKKGTYRYDHLMKLMDSPKKSKPTVTNAIKESEYERVHRIVREAEESVANSRSRK
jgi:hypothetical protein